MSVSIIDIFKSYKNKADGNYDTVATEYANLDIEFVKKNGNQVISADTSWGNSTNDARNLLVLVKGNLTIDAGKTLTAAARKRGMFIYVNGNCTINGTISMTARGASAAGQRLLLCNIGADYEVPAVGGAGANRVIGADGAPPAAVAGNPGTSGVATNACGGGGSGGGHGDTSWYGRAYSGYGGDATSYSGGSGGGGAARAGTGSATAGDGSDTGGVGGAGAGNRDAGGGAGNPGGVGDNTGSAGSNGTGGLLVLYVTGTLTFGTSGTLSSVGSNGGGGRAGGGGSGGGHIDYFYKTISGSAIINVAGGSGGTSSTGAPGGAGGAGSSRATQVALPNLFPSGGAFLLNMV